ncbi:hypothetical protein ATB53_14845 [Xanthomonas translucens]|uniref:Secreted protein n=1 Tax=Xanthomonas campestris pv. translucens TaxID=343 RepID=A0A109HKE9_XANCT|nr:hypothetical protein OZ12_05790 [Xanthomonas translucens pv. translucens]KWV13873.1 hypothetical protein ATB53_14845 [Xanthomonas translucens]KWV14579.1 hypothetical protein ATB54_11725 [Xanthomonas translucens]OAX61481.1 hypothetical protein A6R79_09350 [Xanthomonas translucens pv. translucens]
MFFCLLPLLLCVVASGAGEWLTCQWCRVAIGGGLVSELSLPSAQRLRCACNDVSGPWRPDAVPVRRIRLTGRIGAADQILMGIEAFAVSSAHKGRRWQ